MKVPMAAVPQRPDLPANANVHPDPRAYGCAGVVGTLTSDFFVNLLDMSTAWITPVRTFTRKSALPSRSRTTYSREEGRPLARRQAFPRDEIEKADERVSRRTVSPMTMPKAVIMTSTCSGCLATKPRVKVSSHSSVERSNWHG